MKINTQTPIKTLAGEPIKNGTEGNFTIGLALSNILIENKQGGKMKMFILAQKFFNDKEIDIDEADFNLVKSAVESTENYNNLVNGQILQILSDIKDKK